MSRAEMVGNRSLITDALLRKLSIEVTLDRQTNADRIADKIIALALKGRADILKLLLSYVEGLPTQRVDVTIRQQAERLAEELGLDPDELIAEAERLLAGKYAR